jgi:intracellular septation protein A
MDKLKAALRFALAEFGPLLAFWALALAFDVKVAIAGSLSFILVDGAWRLYRRRPFTRLYLIVSALTLGFGAVDLWVATPFLLVYEAPITNALVGAAFVAGAFGETPMLMEMAQARPGADFPRNAEMRRFFRLFTLLWAAYFFLKAALYLWLAATMPLKEALALRSLLGGISLGIMMALSFTQGRRLFFLCRWLGLLGPRPAAAAEGK